MSAATHGTRASWNAGCRCAICSEAITSIRARHNAEAKKSRDKIKAEDPDAWRARRRPQHRKYRQQQDRAQRLAQQAAYRARHRDTIRAGNARWRENNREYIRAHQAELYAKQRRIKAARSMDLAAVINAAIPRTLPPDIRQEVTQDLAVELLTTGEPVTRAAVAAAVRAYWKRYPLMAGREYSLDVPAYTSNGDSRERRVDMLVDPASLAAMDEDRADRYAGGRR